MKNLKKSMLWKFNRAKSMSGKELIYRVRKEIRKYEYQVMYLWNIEKKYKYKNINEIKIINKYSKVNINKLLKLDYEIYGDKINLNEDIDWHDGMNGKWNKTNFSLRIDTKYSEKIGDIRASWEINRLQFLPMLAMQYKLYEERKVYDTIKLKYYNWIQENKFLNGINWVSSMEIAIRAYQLMITYEILSDIAEEKFLKDIVQTVIRSIKYVEKNLSQYSSANNHLIIEAFIISILGYQLKEVYEQKWFEKGYKILKREMNLQFYEDGINKEQALHYQAFVIDAMLQYNLFLKKINKEPIAEELIKKSIEFMSDLEVDKCNFDFGDSDDAKIISFSSKENNYYKYILELASVYYGKLYTRIDKISDEVRFFTGIEMINKLQKRESNKIKIYKEGGYVTINSNENKLLMDIGELGFGSIAAHGHADALAIILYNKNNPIFIDSGTYIYNVNQEMRDYFRSTKCHNTLSYGEKNQSEIKGPFLWGKRATVKLKEFIESENNILVKAEHDGYNPYIHQRELDYNIKEDRIVLRDWFEDKANINFILDEKMKIERISNTKLRLVYEDSIILVESNLKIDIEKTFISKKFLNKIETNKLVIKNDFRVEKFIETRIYTKNEVE